MPGIGDLVWFTLDRFAPGQPRKAHVTMASVGPKGTTLDLNVILHPSDNPHTLAPEDPDATRTHLVVSGAPQGLSGQPGTWYE